MLFRDTETVLEVLYDIVLMIYVIKIGLIYFLSTFAVGILSSYWIYKSLLANQHLTMPQSELAIIPIQFVLVVISARLIIFFCGVPRNYRLRLFIGSVALLFMVIGEFALSFLLYKEGLGDWILETNLTAGLAFAGLQVAFSLMPSILMLLPATSGRIAKPSYDCETKKVDKGLPSVRATEKRTANKL